MARPTKYTKNIGRKICSRIAEGESVRRIVKDKKMPASSTIYRWLLDDERKEFWEQYAKARNIQAEQMFEELLEIADDGSNDWMEKHDEDNAGYSFNGEHFQRSRLRIDTRKWFLSKIVPKKFGDKIDFTSDGEKIEAGVIILPAHETKNAKDAKNSVGSSPGPAA